jgi:hypothetical protein
MGIEKVPGTPVMFDQLTWVTALEDFTDYVIVRIFCIKKKD